MEQIVLELLQKHIWYIFYLMFIEKPGNIIRYESKGWTVEVSPGLIMNGLDLEIQLAILHW